MHPRSVAARLAIALCLAACAAHATVVYKWTDADGVVHYSDQAVPGAEKLVTSSGSANGIGGANRPAPPAPGTNQPTKPAPAPACTITSPAKEQVFYAEDVVSVSANVQPELGPRQSVAWRLNGNPLDDHAGQLSFSLASLPRGAYTLSATVADQAGDARSADSVTFYVRQPSELAPLHKRP